MIENIARAHEATYSTRERKLSGTHYTPDNVIAYIVSKAVGNVLSSIKDFRELRVIDPACGTGLFLLKAFDVICESLKGRDGHIRAEEVRAVLENCLFGIDLDTTALRLAQESLLKKAGVYGVHHADLSNHFLVGDALDLLKGQSRQLDFDLGVSSNRETSGLVFPEVMASGGFHCMIGNPPYIRIQNVLPLKRRNKYIKSFQTASGRFDISSLFIELGTDILRDGGKLGFIVSNKLLATHGSKQLRRFMLDFFTIEEIIDLADTKLFDAAILPMIIILRRGHRPPEQMIFASVIEAQNGTDNPQTISDLFDVLRVAELPISREVAFNDKCFKVQKFLTSQPASKSTIWTFHSPSESRLLKKIRHNAKCTLQDISQKISVGLKTTADDVFIKPMTQTFIQENRLERDLIYPVLESHNIDRWSVQWQSNKDNFVLYPHFEINGKVLPADVDGLPRIHRYLKAHREKLSSRAYLRDAGRQWFEIWVHQSPSDFAKIKIITPDISATNRFALDRNGYFVNGTCFYIILKNQSIEENLLILALLNSRVIEYFHKTTSGNVLYAKRFRYWTTYLRKYPIPSAFDKEPLVVDKLIANAHRLVAHSGSKDIFELEAENNRLIYQLFELNGSEINEIESTLIKMDSKHTAKDF
jgi:SAM-dependent methyltransferase